jgi:hypothetical protein
MKKTAILLLLILLAAAAFAQEMFRPGTDERIKSYLPGDLVHMVIGAPADVVAVTAVMPDGQKVKLDFERRTHIWHGYWEVPYGFKKGTYYATLTARDVEGKSFVGKTLYFYVGEPALVTLIGLESGSQADGSREDAVRRLAREARISTLEAAAEAERISQVSRAPEIKEVKPPAKRTVTPVERTVKPPVKRTVKPPAKLLLADMEMQKVKLLTGARADMLKKEYERAARQLQALVEIEPDDIAFRKMLDRLQAVIQTREEEE